MDWLHKNSKEEYEKVMQMRRKENLHQNEKISQTQNDEKYMKIKAELKEEATRNAEMVKD